VWGSGGHTGLTIKAYRKKSELSLEEICVSSSIVAVRRAGLSSQERWYTGCHSFKATDRFPLLALTATTFWKQFVAFL